jgi:septal ring factor EnvC (AmiA/AmiB activator)
LGTPESEKPAEYYKREIENSQENIKKASATITHLNAERVNIQLQLLTECLSALNELKMNPPRTLTEEDVLADHMFNAIINDNE